MTRISNSEARSYQSQLRAEQAEETRGRILDATVRLQAIGLATLSIPAVARESGVSVPTIYRHFGTKQDLLAEVYPHVMRRAGLDQPVFPRTMDEFRAGLRGYFEKTDSLGDLARAAMASPGAEETRRLSMPRRIAVFRQVVDSTRPRPSQADRDRIARLMVILTMSSALRTWRDHLGLSVDEAADDLEWVLNAAIAAATARKRR